MALKTALVVDDGTTDPKNKMHEIVEAVLRRKGYSVAHASSVEEARRAIQNERFHLIVSDLDLHKTSKRAYLGGLKVLKAAKARDPSTEFILHSTVFDEKLLTPVAALVRRNAEKQGARVQGKSVFKKEYAEIERK